jgi:predicted dehydrogenase
MANRERLKWGIIGLGSIAAKFAAGLKGSATGTLVAVGSRTQAKAEAFGREQGAARWYGSYEGVIGDPDVEAVYIATPHPGHAEWVIKAAEAGKHILCEKPFTMNLREAESALEAAARNRVFVMEAFMYRCHPQTARLVELVRGGAIGEVRMIQATFSFKAAWNPEGRLLKNELGGGGILDVGGYCVSMSRLIAGVAMGGAFAEPVSLQGGGKVGATGVDDYAAAVLKFPGEILAQVSCGVQLQQESVVRVYGTGGQITVPSPWMCRVNGGAGKLVVTRQGNPDGDVLEIPSERGLYALEADVVARHLGERQAPEMAWDDTRGNMRTLDWWRKAVGVTYAADRQGPGGL